MLSSAYTTYISHKFKSGWTFWRLCTITMLSIWGLQVISLARCRALACYLWSRNQLWKHFRHPTDEQLQHRYIFLSNYYNLQSVHFELAARTVKWRASVSLIGYGMVNIQLRASSEPTRLLSVGIKPDNQSLYPAQDKYWRCRRLQIAFFS